MSQKLRTPNFKQYLMGQPQPPTRVCRDTDDSDVVTVANLWKQKNGAHKMPRLRPKN